MPDDYSARLGLPLLAPGQAQKEITHNEALAIIDLLLQGSVVSVGANTPPGSPDEGGCWIVGATPTGSWAGHARAVAGWSAGGWRFIAPRVGMRLWAIAEGAFVRFDGAEWIVGEVRGTSLVIGNESLLSAPADAIPNPVGGTSVDSEARACLADVLSALRHHRLVLTA